MKEPRVKEIVTIYKDKGLEGVKDYLNQPHMYVEEDTWSGNLKTLINEGKFITAQELIELTAYKFIFKL